MGLEPISVVDFGVQQHLQNQLPPNFRFNNPSNLSIHSKKPLPETIIATETPGLVGRRVSFLGFGYVDRWVSAVSFLLDHFSLHGGKEKCLRSQVPGNRTR